MRITLLALLVWIVGLAPAVPAQTVRVANNSGVPFHGWKRTTIDIMPPALAGLIGTSRYVVGPQIGTELRALDVWVQLAPGEHKALDLATATSAPWTLAPLPGSPLVFFGGPMTVAGVPLTFRALRADGAAYLAHMHCRVGRMLHVDCWVRWYPDAPSLAYGEAIITASNPTVPDMDATAQGLTLAFGDALVIVPGRPVGAPLIANGTRFCDGQARALPFGLVWTRHLRDATDWATAGAATSLGIGAVGISKLLHDGNPQYPPGHSASAWARPIWQQSIARLHDWGPMVIGVNSSSGDTGAQWDQTFVGGEPILPDGVGAEWIYYLAALKWSNRPCHFLELDGKQVDVANHLNPRFINWAGRPHWHHGVSPDRLGKPQDVPSGVASEGGWLGADREHWLMNSLHSAARYTGSPACQWLLAMQAQQVLASETLQPGWSTSGPDAARSVGWLGILCTHIWRDLEDRALATRVRDRWRAKVQQIYVPTIGARTGNIWDPRLDVRLGLPEGVWGWMPWQQSIGAYGLDLGCRVMGPTIGCDIALRAALACVELNWTKLPGESRYRGVGNQPFVVDAEGRFVAPPQHTTPAQFGIDWFETTWDVPAIDVVLRHDPNHVRARELRTQLHAEIGPGRRSWFPPGF